MSVSGERRGEAPPALGDDFSAGAKSGNNMARRCASRAAATTSRRVTIASAAPQLDAAGVVAFEAVRPPSFGCTSSHLINYYLFPVDLM